ncbi:MAG: alpha/beta hydrolase [Asgard group archaeon]|nr:alpha/beta hydrolase [Asgard group archaeon]
MVSTVLLITLGIIFILLIVIIFRYYAWKNGLLATLKDGIVAETKLGKIEYKLAGKGPTILVLHGGPGGYDQGFLLEYLIKQGYSILAPSRTGYLGTPFNPLSYEEQADLCVALMDSLNIEKVVVVGASAGGPVALFLANKYPERVNGLIMEAGVASEYSTEGMLDGWARLFFMRGLDDLTGWLTAVFMKISFAASFKAVLKLETLYEESELDDFVKLVSNDEVRKKWVRDLTNTTLPLSHRKKGLIHDVRLMEKIDIIPVDQISFPTLLIYSRMDNDVKWHHAEYLTENIAHAELFEVHGGHFMWVGENKDEIQKKRIEFLNNLPI